MKMTYFVTLNWNTTGLLKKMIASVEATVSEPHCWVIIDNGSDPQNEAALYEFVTKQFQIVFMMSPVLVRDMNGFSLYFLCDCDTDALIVRSPVNLGCVEGHNLALDAIESLCIGWSDPEVVLINTDVVVAQQGWLDRLHAWLESKPQIGIIGLEHSRVEKCAPAIFLDTNGNWYIQGGQPMHARPVESESVGFGMVMLRRPVLKARLRFDPGYVMYYKQDDDFAFQVRTLGLEVWGFPIDCTHWGSGSLKANKYHVGDARDRGEFEQVKQANQRYFAEKWAWLLRGRRGSWADEMSHLAEMKRVIAERRGNA